MLNSGVYLKVIKHPYIHKRKDLHGAKDCSLQIQPRVEFSINSNTKLLVCRLLCDINSSRGDKDAQNTCGEHHPLPQSAWIDTGNARGESRRNLSSREQVGKRSNSAGYRAFAVYCAGTECQRG